MPQPNYVLREGRGFLMARNILITRPVPDAHATTEQLQALGFSCFIEPMLDISYRENAKEQLAEALKDNCILLITSTNAIRALQNLSASTHIPVITVGDATLHTAREAGFGNVVSAGGNVQTLAEFVRTHYTNKQSFIYARAGIVSENLSQQLARQGFDVTDITVYDANPKTSLSEEFKTRYLSGHFDTALFFSRRTAETFLSLLRKDILSMAPLAQIELFCLSRQVAQPFENTTVKNIRTAPAPTSESLLELVANFQFT